jgi:hypothetical protein
MWQTKRVGFQHPVLSGGRMNDGAELAAAERAFLRE